VGITENKQLPPYYHSTVAVIVPPSPAISSADSLILPLDGSCFLCIIDIMEFYVFSMIYEASDIICI